jgi:hypothetical protein
MVLSAFLLQVPEDVHEAKADPRFGEDRLDGGFLRQSPVDDERSGMIVSHELPEKSQKFDERVSTLVPESCESDELSYVIRIGGDDR